MNDTAIKTSELTKRFGENVAVDSLNLDIQKGELFGLVGPDGAGKTTTMRMLSGIMRPTSGDAEVAGYSITREQEAIKERIGYMSQRFGLYEDLTVMENLLFYADLFLVPEKTRSEQLERLLGFSNLTPFQDRFAGNLSGGMQQKLGLACALIHTPQILFLDEPTNGVDPLSRRDFWKILYDLLKNDITIVVSTAYLDEAERCTRVGLMHDGNLLVTENPVELRETFELTMLQMWVSEPRKAAETGRELDGIQRITVYGDSLHVTLEHDEARETLQKTFEEQGIKIKDQREITPSLEDIFIAKVSA